jgi:4-hydroxy-2-oxoheptanedioate aldolase
MTGDISEQRNAMQPNSTWNLVDTSASLRELWSRGQPTFGGWASIGNAYVTELLGRSGFDWVGIDTQHGLVANHEVAGMLQALAITRTPAIVRVGWNSPDLIMRVLDAGANGVIVPMIDSADDARAAVAACRYPPEGTRSFGVSRAALGVPAYGPKTGNDSVICAVMIETLGATDALDEILSVPGVDAIFIGPSDLALSHGYEPSMDAADPAVARTVLEIRDACRAAGVTPGIFAGTPETAARWADEGFQLIALLSDAALVAQGAHAMVSRLSARTAAQLSGG